MNAVENYVNFLNVNFTLTHLYVADIPPPLPEVIFSAWYRTNGHKIKLSWVYIILHIRHLVGGKIWQIITKNLVLTLQLSKKM